MGGELGAKHEALRCPPAVKVLLQSIAAGIDLFWFMKQLTHVWVKGMMGEVKFGSPAQKNHHLC